MQCCVIRQHGLEAFKYYGSGWNALSYVINSENLNSLVAPQYVAEGEQQCLPPCLLVKATAHKSPFATLHLQSKPSNPGCSWHPAAGMKEKRALSLQHRL